MDANNEQMILSLLNLYTTYINVKKSEKNADKTSFHTRIPTKRPYDFITKVIKNHPERSTFAVARNPPTLGLKGNNPGSSTPINNLKIRGNNAVATDKEVSGESGAICASKNALMTESESSQLNSFVISEPAGTFKEKVRVKRRKRGEAKRAKEMKQKMPRIRRWRVRPINIDRGRTGYHRKVFSNVKKMEPKQFFEHTRMSKPLFDWLLSFTHTSLRKSRQSILPEERLALTLHYLAYGTPLQSIAFKHKVGKSTARQIVLDTCNVLWNLLSPLYLSEPTAAQFADIAEDFESKWRIPNCVGAIDAKRVLLSNPRNKDDNILHLLAACDTKYKFSIANVGSLNNQNEHGLFQLLSSRNAEIYNDLPFPANKPLFQSSLPFPHFFISDTSFPLQKNVICPYTDTDLDTTKSIFNFKISRARSITENTFGILTARFRVLLTKIEFLPEGCQMVVLACIVLHNYIMTNDEDQLYCPPNFVDVESESGIIEEGAWRNELKSNGDEPLSSTTTSDNSSSYDANKLRDTLANYFSSEATVSYEIEII